jgi:putative transposon-encoded protein
MVKDLKIKLKSIEIQEVLERDISDFGTSSHAILPKKHSGKKAIILVEK